MEMCLKVRSDMEGAGEDDLHWEKHLCERIFSKIVSQSMSWGEMLMVLEIVSLTGFVTCFYGALSKQQKKMSKEATTPLCLVNNWNHIFVFLHLHTFTDLFGASALRKHSIKINWRFLALAGKAVVVAVVNCDNACLYHSYRPLQDISPAGKQDYS